MNMDGEQWMRIFKSNVEVKNNCFGSEKHNMTLHQAKTGKYNCSQKKKSFVKGKLKVDEQK